MIPASPLGRLKTIVQVAMVMALIAATTPAPVGAGARLRGVAITLISGADYFLNVRRKIEESRRRRLASEAKPSS